MQNYITLLATNIKKYRLMRCLTQEKLADLLYITKQSVSKWELGISIPTTENIIYMCSLLNCTANNLLEDSIHSINQSMNSTQPIKKNDNLLSMSVSSFSMGMSSLSNGTSEYTRKSASEYTGNIANTQSFDNRNFSSPSFSVHNSTSLDSVDTFVTSNCNNMSTSYSSCNAGHSTNANDVYLYFNIYTFVRNEEIAQQIVKIIGQDVESFNGIVIYNKENEICYFNYNNKNFETKNIKENEKYNITQYNPTFDEQYQCKKAILDNIELFELDNDFILAITRK